MLKYSLYPNCLTLETESSKYLVGAIAFIIPISACSPHLRAAVTQVSKSGDDTSLRGGTTKPEQNRLQLKQNRWDFYMSHYDTEDESCC